MRIAFDLDGVLCHWHQSVYDYLVGTDKYEGSYEDFWISDFNSLPLERQSYILSLPFLYESHIVDYDIVDVMNKLAKISEIYYITARDTALRRITERWLRTNKLPYSDNLIMTKDKVSYIKLYKIDFFVDDFAKQVIEVGKYCTSFLFANPWNREQQDELPTVRSIEEFYNIVKEI